MRFIPIAIVCAMALPTAAFAQATTAPDYVKMAGAGDKFEIESSRTVLVTSKDAKTRKFAQQMITDHTKSTAMIKSAALKDHVRVMPAMLDPMQADNLQQLKAATGMSRDQLYMQQQAAAHQQALALHQGYASGGDKPALMATAAKIVPVVQSHIDMLGGMGGSMSGM